MTSFGERITKIICDAEIKRRGYVAFDGLAERLAFYIRGAERKKYLADASKIEGEAVTDLTDAFYLLLPCENIVLAHDVDGRNPRFTIEPWTLGKCLWRSPRTCRDGSSILRRPL